jgi:hypothetical protein
MSFFFSDKEQFLKSAKPLWANVVCYNSKRNVFCYAYQDDKGILNAGYEIGNNDFSIQLSPEFFVVIEKVDSLINDFISIKQYIPNCPINIVADYQKKINLATCNLSANELK